MGFARSIPTTPWSQQGSRWTTRPLGLAVLLVGLWIFGTGEALLLASTLGNSPWAVLAQGVSLQTPLSVGVAFFLISLAVLLLWIPVRERPGLGTVMNAVVIAAALDVMLRIVGTDHATPTRIVLMCAGVLVLALGGSLYLTCNLGPGPRDGLMTGLHNRFGWPIAAVRTGLEVSALTAGWVLGGTVGVGTAVFALGVGPALAGFLGMLERTVGTRTISPDQPSDHAPRSINSTR